MIIPNQWKGNSAVFCYSHDLIDNANNLAFALNEPEYYKYWISSNIRKAERRRAKVVWLVGHGLSSTRNILDINSHGVVDIIDVFAWCQTYGTLELIDTCCYPSARKAAKNTSTYTGHYYCKNQDLPMAGLGLTQSTTSYFTQLQTWWNTQGIEKV